MRKAGVVVQSSEALSKIRSSASVLQTAQEQCGTNREERRPHQQFGTLPELIQVVHNGEWVHRMSTRCSRGRRPNHRIAAYPIATQPKHPTSTSCPRGAS